MLREGVLTEGVWLRIFELSKLLNFWLKAFATHREEAISSLFDALDVKQRGVLEAWELKLILILILILPLT